MKYLFLIIGLVIVSRVIAIDKQPALLKLYTDGNYEQLIETTREFLDKDSSVFAAWYYQGLGYQALYRFNYAITSFNRALTIEPHKIQALFNLANSYNYSGDDEKAIEAYLNVLELDSLHIAAKIRLASIYKDMNEYLKAVELFGRLVKQDTTNGYYYSQLAYCCKKAGIDFPVIGYYKMAIQLNPNDLVSARSLINELIDNQLYEDADTLLDEFVSQRPEDIQFLKLRAYLSALEGNYLDAVRTFNQVVQLGDSSLFTSKFYGQSLYNNGEYEKAIFWLERYLAKKSDDVQNQAICGLACQKNYQYEDAIHHLQLAINATYDRKKIGWLFNEMGDTYSGYGDYTGFRDSTGLKAPEKYSVALKNYLVAEEIYPEDVSVYKYLAVLYETRMKDAKFALYYYQKYYEKLDSKKLNSEELLWLEAKIGKLKEEVHFMGN